MAELIGVVSGVMGVALPVINQIERLVDRCQGFRSTPADFLDLKSHCEAASASLRRLNDNLRQNPSIAPDHVQRFRDDAERVKTNFEKAEAECHNLDKYFPTTTPDSGSCHGFPLISKQALLRFLLAGRIARKCEEISRIIKDANVNGTALNHFLHTAVRINHVGNEVKQVGVGVANVDRKVTTMDEKVDTIDKSIKHVGDGMIAVDNKVTTMDEKTDTIEKGVKHVGVDVTTIKEMLTTTKETTAADTFKCVYHVPALSQGIILDFSTCDAEGEPVTMEGKLKRALLQFDSHSDSSRIAAAVGAGGMGGVGKTNALLGLGWDSDVREQFRNGGIHFLSIGKDAGVGEVIEELALAVQVSGGAGRARDIRESKTLRGAIEIVMSWFEERETLFLCDDLWETAQSSVGYFTELKQLLTPRGRSRMVLSTRNQRIAIAAGIAIEFGPRDPEGDLSRAILLKYAGISEEVVTRSCEKCPEAIRKILRTCGGIPIILGVAGRAVQMKARYCDGGWETAIALYAKELETSTRNMMTEDIEGYPNFCATVKTSLDMVDVWAQKNGVGGESGEALVCSDLFTRMSVFPRQSRIPQSVVKRLWSDADKDDVVRIIEKLVDVNLMSKKEDEKNGVFVGLHDLVLEYCVIRAGGDASRLHRELLRAYLTVNNDVPAESGSVGDCSLDNLSKTPESRAWWSLSSTGYFPENVCRHLWKGACLVELMALLCDVRWTVFRMRCGGLLGWKRDFESLTAALSGVKNKREGPDDWNKVENGFGLVREAVNEAWGSMQGNERELGMQVYSRLFKAYEGGLAVSRYLRSVLAHCEKPWLLPRGRYWNLPRTSENVELLVGVDADSIAMIDDGSVVAVSVGNEVFVMNVESRMILWRQDVHEDKVPCVCTSGDGAMVVSGSSDRTLRRWDGKSGEPLGEPLCGHDDEVNCVAMSQDGAMIVSGSEDRTLRRWDGKSGEPVGYPLCGHKDGVSCIAISGDGAMIVSGSWDGTLRRWDGKSGEPVGEPLRGHHGEVSCIAMSKDGAMIVSGSWDETLRRWDGESGAPVGDPLCGHHAWVSCIAMSQDGAMIVSGSWDKTLRLWDGESGEPLGDPMRGHDLSVFCVAMSQDGKMIVSGSGDRTLRRWDRGSGAPLGEALCRHDGEVFCLAMSQDGTMIVSGSEDDRTLRRWDGKSGEPVGEPLCGHDADVSCIAMSKDGKMIVSGSWDRTLRRWHGKSGEPLGEPLCGHEGDVSCIAISEDGTMMVSGSSDGTLRRWDSASGEPLGDPLYGHGRPVNSVAISEDGAMILSSSLGSERLWDAETGSAIEIPVQNKTMGGEEFKRLVRSFVDANGAGESDASSSCELRVSSRQVIWEAPTGAHVLATLPAEIMELCSKRVSFRAGGTAEDDGESSYLVGAVAAVGLSNGMVCIFHLVTE